MMHYSPRIDLEEKQQKDEENIGREFSLFLLKG